MRDNQLKEGVKAALPIVLGYLPVGMAFGVLARQAGLSPLESGSMSLLVYAGASQFIAVEMISKGIPWGSDRSYDLFYQPPASPDEFHSFPLL
jgi:predicted branched-subunit amino acid permease